MNSSKAPLVAGVDQPGRRTVYSMCGMCAVRCPIQVEVEDGKVVWLQGNPNDKTMGTSLCAKGAAGVVLEYDDEQRPQHPLIRAGARGEGKWKRATWDEALDYVADKLKAIIEQHGARSVILSDRGGPFSDLPQSFLKALGSPNYINHDATCGRNAHHASKSLFGIGRKDFSYDIKNTKHIVLYGRNMIESLQVKEAKDFIAALQKGAKCTYIDPRATITASKATRHWQIRPNTEYALTLAIINYTLAEGLYDKDFVGKWVTGLAELKNFVDGKTPEWQEQFTGIPADEVKRFVREIAQDAPNVIFHGGWFTARHKQSFYSSRAIYLLNALFGSIEVPGGLIFTKSFKDYGLKSLNKLGARVPDVEEERADGCGSTYKQFDASAGIIHLMWRAIDSGEPYPLKAYIAYRHDPLTSLPDPEAQKRILDKLDLIVSVDVNFSETAWFADVILPESTYLERANLLAGKSGIKPSIHMRDQAVAPRFDSRPNWWIFRELARRLDIGEYFDFETIEEIWAYQLEGTGVGLKDVRDKGVLSMANETIFFDRDKDLPFKTASGKIEMVSQRLADAGLESFVEFEPPEPVANGEFMLLFGRVGFHTHGQTQNNPLLNELMPEAPVWIHPDRAMRLGIEDGDRVEVSGGSYSATGPARVTPWIHPDAVFMVHGFGQEISAKTRSFKRGISDQRLMEGLLDKFDPAGGGMCLTEARVRVTKA